MLNSTRLLITKLRRGRSRTTVCRHTTTIALATLAIATALGPSTPADAQDEAPSLVELKAAAYDAQQAAAAADRAAAEAKSQAAQAQSALEQVNQTPPAPAPAQPAPAPISAPPASVIALPAPPPAPPPAPVTVAQPAPAPAPPPAQPPAPAVTAAPAAVASPEATERPVTREELDRALEKAEQAAAQAARALAELEAYKEKQKKRYARNGFYFSGGAFWAPQLFDTDPSFDFDPSLGLSGGLGYRVHPHFSVDASFVWANGFDIENESLNGSYDDLQIWSALIGGRFIFLTGKFQPYMGVGFGATGGRAKFRDAQGVNQFEFKEVGGTIAFNGGFDLYLSENVALGADAAIYLPGGDMQGFDYSTLGAKLIYRF